MTTKQILTEGLKFVVNGGFNELIGASPNQSFLGGKTLGGHHCWTNMAHYNGWRVQRWGSDGHYRVLDNNDYRWAWGSKEEIIDMFKMLIDYAETLDENEKKIAGEKIKKALQTGNFATGPEGVY